MTVLEQIWCIYQTNQLAATQFLTNQIWDRHVPCNHECQNLDWQICTKEAAVQYMTLTCRPTWVPTAASPLIMFHQHHFDACKTPDCHKLLTMLQFVVIFKASTGGRLGTNHLYLKIFLCPRHYTKLGNFVAQFCVMLRTQENPQI